MSKRLFCIGIALLALCAIKAQAVPLTWTLVGVTLADGSTASGSFVYDADTNLPNGTFSNISITTTAGTTVTASTFAYLNPGVTSFSLRFYPVTTTGNLTGTPAMQFFFPSPLTDAGGTVPIMTGVSSVWAMCIDSNCNAFSVPVVNVTAGAVMAVGSGAASTYFTTYYSSNVAAAPDETLRIINDGGNGSLWASIYVFDDSEELTQCCTCVISPDGVLSESVKLNLTANPIRGNVNSRGVIKVISSLFPGYLGNDPTPGLRVWMTHVQGTKVTLSPGKAVVPAASGPFFVTETEAAHSNLTVAEDTLLDNLCVYDALLSGQPCTCQPEDYDF